MGWTWEIGTHTFPIVWVISVHTISIIWYTSWVSYWISHSTRKCNIKLIVWGEPGKLVLTLFPCYGRFFSIRFPFYGILHHVGNACVFSLISHNLGNNSQNHRMGNVWEIGSQKYPTKLIVCGELGELVPRLLWVLISLDSHSVVYFIICEIHGFLIQFPWHGKMQWNPPNWESLGNWYPFFP